MAPADAGTEGNRCERGPNRRMAARGRRPAQFGGLADARARDPARLHRRRRHTSATRTSSRRTGLPKATVSRLTYPRSPASATCTMTTRCSAATASAPPPSRSAIPPSAPAPVIHIVAAPDAGRSPTETGAAVALGARDGLEMVYLANCRSMSPVSLPAQRRLAPADLPHRHGARLSGRNRSRTSAQSVVAAARRGRAGQGARRCTRLVDDAVERATAAHGFVGAFGMLAQLHQCRRRRLPADRRIAPRRPHLRRHRRYCSRATICAAKVVGPELVRLIAGACAPRLAGQPDPLHAKLENIGRIGSARRTENARPRPLSKGQPRSGERPHRPLDASPRARPCGTAGQVLFEIDNDKAAVEVEAPGNRRHPRPHGRQRESRSRSARTSPASMLPAKRYQPGRVREPRAAAAGHARRSKPEPRPSAVAKRNAHGRHPNPTPLARRIAQGARRLARRHSAARGPGGRIQRKDGCSSRVSPMHGRAGMRPRARTSLNTRSGCASGERPARRPAPRLQRRPQQLARPVRRRPQSTGPPWRSTCPAHGQLIPRAIPDHLDRDRRMLIEATLAAEQVGSAGAGRPLLRRRARRVSLASTRARLDIRGLCLIAPGGPGP
jgi:hypothetical protein